MPVRKRRARNCSSSNAVCRPLNLSQSFKSSSLNSTIGKSSLKRNNVELAKELQEKRLENRTIKNLYLSLISQTQAKFSKLGANIFQCIEQLNEILNKLYNGYNLCREKTISYPNYLKNPRIIVKNLKQKGELATLKKDSYNVDIGDIDGDDDDTFNDNGNITIGTVIPEEITFENIEDINDEKAEDDRSPNNVDINLIENKTLVSSMDPSKPDDNVQLTIHNIHSSPLLSSLQPSTPNLLNNVETISARTHSNLPLFNNQKAFINPNLNECVKINFQVEDSNAKVIDYSLMNNSKIDEDFSSQSRNKIVTHKSKIKFSNADSDKEIQKATKKIKDLKAKPKNIYKKSQPPNKQKNTNVKILAQVDEANKHAHMKKTNLRSNNVNNLENIAASKSSFCKSVIKTVNESSLINKVPEQKQILVEGCIKESSINQPIITDLMNATKPISLNNITVKDKIDLKDKIGAEIYEQEINFFARKDKIPRTPVKSNNSIENILPNQPSVTASVDHNIPQQIIKETNNNHEKLSNSQPNREIAFDQFNGHQINNLETLISDFSDNSSLDVLNMDIISTILDDDTLTSAQSKDNCIRFKPPEDLKYDNINKKCITNTQVTQPNNLNPINSDNNKTICEEELINRDNKISKLNLSTGTQLSSKTNDSSHISFSNLQRVTKRYNVSDQDINWLIACGININPTTNDLAKIKTKSVRFMETNNLKSTTVEKLDDDFIFDEDEQENKMRKIDEKLSNQFDSFLVNEIGGKNKTEKQARKSSIKIRESNFNYDQEKEYNDDNCENKKNSQDDILTNYYYINDNKMPNVSIFSDLKLNNKYKQKSDATKQEKILGKESRKISVGDKILENHPKNSFVGEVGKKKKVPTATRR